MCRRKSMAIGLFLTILIVIPSAYADTVTLDNANQSGLVGSPMIFSGSITNTTGFTQLLGIYSGSDDTGPSFFPNTLTSLFTEITLGPGASTADIPLFEFTINSFSGHFRRRQRLSKRVCIRIWEAASKIPLHLYILPPQPQALPQSPSRPAYCSSLLD